MPRLPQLHHRARRAGAAGALILLLGGTGVAAAQPAAEQPPREPRPPTVDSPSPAAQPAPEEPLAPQPPSPQPPSSQPLVPDGQSVPAPAPASDAYLLGVGDAVVSDPVGSRLIDVASPFTVGRRRLEFMVTHRFRQAVNQGGTGHNLYGLDGGADVGFGLTYGVLRRLDLSVYRSQFQEDYELAGKVQLLEQSRRVPLSAALRAGADLLGQKTVVDPHRPFAQLLLGRRLAPGWNVFVSPSWVHGTPLLRNAWNVPVGLTAPLPGHLLLDGELIAANRALRRLPGASRFAWHAALTKQLGWHLFQVVVGNSRATTVDQTVGGDFAAGFTTHDVRLGFNLIRYFSP